MEDNELTVGETAAITSAITAAVFSIKRGGARRMPGSTSEIKNEERIEELLNGAAKLIHGMCEREMSSSSSRARCIQYAEERVQAQIEWYQSNHEIITEAKD